MVAGSASLRRHRAGATARKGGARAAAGVLLAALVASCGLPGVRNAVVTFTGDITVDFTTDYFSLPDRKCAV